MKLMMTLKEQVVQELDNTDDLILTEVLDFLKFLKAKAVQKREIAPGMLMSLKGILKGTPDLSDEARGDEYVDYLIQKYQ